MEKQQAIKLAELLEQFQPIGNPAFVLEREAAAELRRLHAENERLRADYSWMQLGYDDMVEEVRSLRAAIDETSR